MRFLRVRNISSIYLTYVFKGDGTFRYHEGGQYSGVHYVGTENWEGKFISSNGKISLTEVKKNDRAVQNIEIEYSIGYDEEYKRPIMEIARLYETPYIDMEYAREFRKSE